MLPGAPRGVLAALLLLTLPASAPPASAEADAGTAVTGAVVRAWAEGDVDHAHSETPELLTWIDPGPGEAPVPVDTAELDHVPTGALVTARLGADDAGDGGAAPHDVLAAQVVAPVAEVGAEGDLRAELAAGATPHTVTVVLALPAGATPDGMTVSQVTTMVEGPVSQFWSEQTGGLVSFDVDREQSWLRLNAPCSDPWRMWTEAAASVGFTGGPGKHLLLYVPSASSLPECYAGLASVGRDGLASGGVAYVRTGLPSLVAHELGHNLGLGHSDGLLCPTTSDGTYTDPAWGNSCRMAPYRDHYDVMGASWTRFGTLSAPHADRLGVLGAGVRSVTTPTTATLRPVSALSGLRALRITDPGGGTYYVEFRPASGRDSYLASSCQGCPPLQAGVLVRRAVADDGTVLLDATPTGSTHDWAQALVEGSAMVTASGRVTVRVDDVGTGAATLSVLVDGKDPLVRDELVSSPEPVSAPTFSDVPAGAYFHDPVRWSAAERITVGTSATTFSPYQVVTRAQATTFLWRAKGEPAPEAAAVTFGDVPSGSYYGPAVAWASSGGITSGTSASLFSPHAPLTRQQAVTLLWRLAGEPVAARGTRFTDVPPDSYAAPAIAWAQEAGITSGTSATAFSPKDPVSRAQMVTFLHRLLVG